MDTRRHNPVSALAIFPTLRKTLHLQTLLLSHNPVSALAIFPTGLAFWSHTFARVVTIQYQPWQSFRRNPKTGLENALKLSQSSISPGNLSDAIIIVFAAFGQEVTIQYQPWQSFRQRHKEVVWVVVVLSQSSISPGNLSDLVCLAPTHGVKLRSQSSISPGNLSDFVLIIWSLIWRKTSQSSISPGNLSDSSLNLTLINNDLRGALR